MKEAPRVFVSSVMSGFEPYRTAAQQGIIDAEMTPVLIEDFPSLDASSRTACLDLVQSSDVYIVIIGDRAGSSPLGKPVVEEEFEEARRRKLPRLLFLQDIARDVETEALTRRLSDFVAGRFRTTFDTPDDLRSAVAAALRELSTMNIEKNDASLIEEVLARRGGENTPMLRLAFVPERKDEVFDILEFDAPAFRRSIFQLAHHDDVRVLDFEQAKEVNVEDRELVIHQQKRGNSTGIGATIRVRENGAIVIDQTLSGRTQDRQHFGFDMQIVESDIVETIRSAAAFVHALYDKRDPGQRYATFLFGAAVAEMNMHFVVEQRREQRSWSLRMNDERGWVILDKPRRLDRTDLENPAEVITRLVAFIGKRYGERK